ncbi:sigma-54 interaction domain-containing protein [Hornefia butyriciproducens]|uniref:sigma-54 interaction domain-containing protein n=1 Tax=Hornefia butyriciproducens TaxID=2652293 RepID=UPI002A91E683|nr:sigma 54-interacting transcriptional regulator [Hornefia butyriciproducens]MDY5463084.1 sigma 54-interacting transcriptional regulator [Hornefia butyriciproducens]
MSELYNEYLKQFSNLYDSIDAVLIINVKGYVEYSAFIDENSNAVRNDGYTGKHILDVYPDLREDNSAFFSVLRTQKPVINEIQTHRDINGNTLSYICNTYPLTLNNELIGVISGAIYLDEEGNPKSRNRKSSNKRKENFVFKLYDLDDIITINHNMIDLKERVRRIAKTTSSIMIVGATGTGKELFAQSIHSQSPRHLRPFVSQNCSAIPSELLESTLFGTTKGSYTGAEDKKGLFELANGGTLFLDELNSMNINLQAKILKAVEEQKIRRVGDEKVRCVDVRIVSALNQDPQELIRTGTMRSDLFYRLGVVTIYLPSLVEHKEDIPVLINYFIEKYNRKSNHPITGYSDLALSILMNHSWPGNIRELRNTVEYGVNVATKDVLSVNDLPDNILRDTLNHPQISTPRIEQNNFSERTTPTKMQTGQTLKQMVENYERTIIQEVYDHSKNANIAAKTLGISRQSLQYKLQKYHIRTE